MLGACAQMGDLPKLDMLASSKSPADEAPGTTAPQSELQKATEYWGKQFAKKPNDAEAALAYAKNLKALGQKQQALAVLQQASLTNGSNRKLASEYGRLALEFDQIAVAEQLLAMADDPALPDWRVVSARGTVLAKQGKYSEAIPYYERALSIASDQPSVLNNLALAYTMSGDAAKAEGILRQASQSQGGDRKIRQNLALVLNLQGKYDEARQVAMQDAAPEAAKADSDLMRSIVRLDPKAVPAPAGGPAEVQLARAPSPKAAPRSARPCQGRAVAGAGGRDVRSGAGALDPVQTIGGLRLGLRGAIRPAAVQRRAAKRHDRARPHALALHSGRR